MLYNFPYLEQLNDSGKLVEHRGTFMNVICHAGKLRELNPEALHQSMKTEKWVNSYKFSKF